MAPDLATNQLVALDLDTSASLGSRGITMRSDSTLDVAAKAMIDAVRTIVSRRNHPA